MDSQHRFSFSPVDREITCIHNTYNVNPINENIKYHRHDAYEIYLFISGNANYYIEQACYNLNPGDMIVLSPSEMHASACLDDGMYNRIFINIKKTVIDRLSTKKSNLFTCFDSHPLGQKNLIHLSEEDMKQYIVLTEKLSECLVSGIYGADVMVDAYLAQILVFVNNHYMSSSFPGVNIMPELIRNTMKYIEEHLLEEISLAQLERIFFLSGTYISRQFKKHTGLTIRNYLLEQRIAYARKLLNQGKNVSEACYLSGFRDYANFIRSFTKVTGISPGQMKKSVK